MSLLPPLRLVGATILREGEMRQRSVAVARGRITKGPLPAVDLSGYLILPGIVDLGGAGIGRHVHPAEGLTLDPAAALAAIDREAAASGVTTAWMTQGWSWAGGSDGPDAAEAMMDALGRYRRQALTDLRLQLRVETHLVGEGARLLAAIRRRGLDYVVFANTLDQAAERLRGGPEDVARWSARAGRTPAEQRAAVEGALARAREVPRHLCTLGEAFDQMGVAYGSRGDAGGEVRELYSMIGARIAECPAAIGAAAAARAMGDPVLVAAPEVIGRPPEGAGSVSAPDLIGAGLCDALISDCFAPSLAAAAFALVDAGLRSLPQAWGMISARPAEVMRLADRGTLDYGRRADLVIVDAATRRIECTIAAGRITHLAGGAAARFVGALGAGEGRPAAHRAGGTIAAE